MKKIKISIPKIKLPELKEETKDKLIRGTKTTAKTLLGLFALGVCLKGCGSCARSVVAWDKKVKAEEALDQKTPATLIDKNITLYNGDCQNIALYFDTDGTPQTAEATLVQYGLKAGKALKFYNVTNGTTKSVADWKKMVDPNPYVNRKYWHTND